MIKPTQSAKNGNTINATTQPFAAQKVRNRVPADANNFKARE
ncbi:hypothetical protein [Glutamicibacter sp. M10]|nr:hypothetical protein [Glutamicibacter sp. M10]UXN32206.1 hypothetical protein N6V40_01505 [Glutamicibacter sp. M10]